MHASYLPIRPEIRKWTKMNSNPLICNDVFRVFEINDSLGEKSLNGQLGAPRFTEIFVQSDLVQVYDKRSKPKFEGFRFRSTTAFPSGGGVCNSSPYVSICGLSLQVLITFRMIPNSSKKFCFSVVEFSSKNYINRLFRLKLV